MESNSDKHLRDKLSSTEFPFDPQAWEQMEAMLDKKKKRRGFFWWWTGGIAAALLFTVIGYEIGVGSKLQVAGGRLNTGASEIRNQKSEANTITVSSSKQQHNAKGNGDKSEIRNITNKQSAGANEAMERNINHQISETKIVGHRTSSKKKLKENLLAKSANENTNTNTNRLFGKVNPYKEETEMLASMATKNSLAERIEMDKRAGLLESTTTDYSLNKMNEDALPKNKEKIFHYSLGVVGNVTGTTLGNQTLVSANVKAPLFYNQPSYAVGFTHEFLFLNRIAITNSILFSKTSFKVYQPHAPADSSSIKNYSSVITELQIPIGIKVYPVIKKYFRFSISAGIINHIKLKEVFTVEKEPVPNIPNNIIALDNTFVSVADNPFMNSKSVSNSTFSGTATQGEQAEYYGMGGLRRYYASFYASAGIEFIAQKHFVFFTEPMFYMSLNKIGLQDKRKYNVGVNGGFRYQF